MTTPLKIVRLDGVYAESPAFTIPHTYVEFLTTPDPATIPGRIGDADVVITTTVPITASTLEACPNLKFVAVLAIGYDMVDLAACKARGVLVANVPAASNEAVAEHAIAFYFALRRNLVGMYSKLVDGKEDWKAKGSLVSTWGGLPHTCRAETLCIIGGGELGNRVASIGRALSMNVLLADRKTTPASSLRPGRTDFHTALRTSTVIILTLPLTAESTNLIGAAEFEIMRPDAVLINVARGGIVDEESLVRALKEKKIAGAATDVYVKEPSGAADNPILRCAEEFHMNEGGKWDGMEGRLVVSPHVAWFAASSIEKLRRTVVENVEGWSRGEPKNLVEST